MNNTYISEAVRKYKSKGLLIDTNIALLYLIGSLDFRKVRNYRRTAQYSENDFYFVWRFIEYFSVRITTPHILTEISDLLGNGRELQEVLRNFIAVADEIYELSDSLSKSAPFLEVGLADTAILAAAKNKNYLVLTDDGPLQAFLSTSKIDFVSLDHIRQK